MDWQECIQVPAEADDILSPGNTLETICWMLNSNGTFRSSATIQPALVSKANWTLSGVGNLMP